MKEMRIMRAIGDIDDIYIDEAAPVQITGKRPLRFAPRAVYAGIAACAVLAVGIGIFAANNSDIGVNSPTQTSAPVSEPAATDDGEVVLFSSPFTDYATLEEAIQAVGFDISVPDSFGTYTERNIQTIDRNMIEITYYDKSGTEGLRIRKAPGSDDISGDFNTYDNSKSSDIGGRSVTMQGSGEKFFKAIWTEDGYAYSVSSGGNGLSQSELEEIIKNVK